VQASLDLGRSSCVLLATDNRLQLPDGVEIDSESLAEEVSDDADCILLRPNGPEKVYHYSEALSKHYKLFQPFEDRAPTIVINSATMHTVVRKDPWQDAVDKVRAAGRVRGRCLDTCCGLGYSAQLLSTSAGEVVTCEVDLNVLDVCAVNPWSEGLFHRPNIEIHLGDQQEYVANCADGSFDAVFHDPPTVYQAGELYSEALYRQFARILRPGGLMYHYVGEPGKKRGQDYSGGVMRRMQSAGFTRVRRVTSGVLATRAKR
jgi:predicted methyltransferase